MNIFSGVFNSKINFSKKNKRFEIKEVFLTNRHEASFLKAEGWGRLLTKGKSTNLPPS